MNKHLLFVTVIATFLVTCKGQDYSKELATIDSLKMVLISTDSLIQSADKADIQKKSDEIANNSKFIQFNVNQLKDTLDFNTALLLTDYRSLGKEYKMMSTNIGKMEAAMDSAALSLDNLKHDLTNHSLAEGIDAKTSVQMEAQQIADMHEYAMQMVKTKKETREAYDTLLPKVNAFVQQMSGKIEVSQKK